MYASRNETPIGKTRIQAREKGVSPIIPNGNLERREKNKR